MSVITGENKHSISSVIKSLLQSSTVLLELFEEIPR